MEYSREGFFEPLLDKITALKLRGSWGKLGNQNIGSQNISNAYPSVSVVSSGQNYSFNQTVAPGIAPTSGANADITWERTTLTDVGLDLTLFHNKLNFTADYYVKNTNGILLQLPASVVYGFSTPYRNAGAVRNSDGNSQRHTRIRLGPLPIASPPTLPLIRTGSPTWPAQAPCPRGMWSVIHQGILWL